MSDAEKIILTAAVTLIGGMVLFIISEYIRVFILVPVQKLNEQIQIAIGKVDFHCNMLTNYFPKEPSEEERKTIHEIKKDLRSAATQLNSKYSVISWKKHLIRLKLIPSAENIDIAYSGLIYLHNSILYSGRRDFVINEIEMNDNQIDRIQAALKNQPIPKRIAPKEKQK